MPKANLTLLGVGLSLNAAGAKAALADECQLPEADINAACEALFDRKIPFILIKNVELAVAASHFGQLKALGFDCEVDILDDQETVGKSKSAVKRNCAVAAVCVLSVAIGSGYFFYTQKTTQPSPVVAEQNAQLPEIVKIAAATESTQFHQWRSRLDGINNLKRVLDQLSSNWLQARIINSAEEPLSRTVATNYATQLAIQQFDSAGQDSRTSEYHRKLDASLAAIDRLPASFDQFYATLELADVYQQLGRRSAAQSTFKLAKNFVSAGKLNKATDIVIAEVALAEHQHLYGRAKNRDAHLAAAAKVVDSGFETGTGKLKEWSIAYIARSEAKVGLFVKAHRRLRTISDQQIKDSAMVDISSYAVSDDNEPDLEILNATGLDFIVD